MHNNNDHHHHHNHTTFFDEVHQDISYCIILEGQNWSKSLKHLVLHLVSFLVASKPYRVQTEI